MRAPVIFISYSHESEEHRDRVLALAERLRMDGLDARWYEAMHLWYDLHMRTTISLDDRLARAVRERAARKGKSVSAFIAGILDDALKRPAPREEQPFRLVTVAGGGVRAGVDLDRPRELEVEEDEADWSEAE